MKNRKDQDKVVVRVPTELVEWQKNTLCDHHSTMPNPMAVGQDNNKKMKKALRETQTLRAGCSKAEPKISAPPQNPFPGARGGQNLISWRWSQPSPTDPIW